MKKIVFFDQNFSIAFEPKPCIQEKELNKSKNRRYEEIYRLYADSVSVEISNKN